MTETTLTPPAAQSVRYDWTLDEVRRLFDWPLLDLIFRAQQIHRQYHDAAQVQVCKLISIKTGGCPEDCAYCSQSSRYETSIEPTGLMQKEEVVAVARRAKAAGVSRVCMGAAWRQVKDNRQFEEVLEIVREVAAVGVEVCCTLGMLSEDQARRLEEAGCYAYNHNLDTSENYYDKIITTRKYSDRINTLKNVRKTGVTVCTGGIIGLGESVEDRISLLHTLATMRPHPESVPINVLSKVPGTPLADQADVPAWETARMIAAARILMPRATVRLSAGRAKMSVSDQAICFMAGANSIFSSESGVMLTRAVPSPDYDADKALLNVLGLVPRAVGA
ncbi:MAG TPA: biotin synthase BioB [Tepidisphaeraceae bacterium]|nr:biotin synthase BioB [Tepidisphaeraceae bacterium]